MHSLECIRIGRKESSETAIRSKREREKERTFGKKGGEVERRENWKMCSNKDPSRWWRGCKRAKQDPFRAPQSRFTNVATRCCQRNRRGEQKELREREKKRRKDLFGNFLK